jgi:hypothetical protein
MNRFMKILFVFILAVVVLIPGAGIALADDGQNEGITTSDDVLVPEGLIPGVDGYKVFGPNAVVSLIPKSKNSNDKLLDDPLWSANTDAYKYGTTVYGSHTSQSSFSIQDIWVDGAIKKSGDGWFDSDRDHTTGLFANCNTQMTTGTIKYTYIAHSWHHFHEYGYPDWNPETEDSVYG